MEVGKIYQHIVQKDMIVQCIQFDREHYFKGLILDLDEDKYVFYKIGQTEYFSEDRFMEYTKNESPITEQIGGDHYKKLKIQPTEFIHENNIGFIEGNIIKYVVRHKDKNGLEDLKKAKHYIDLLIKFEYENPKSV